MGSTACSCFSVNSISIATRKASIAVFRKNPLYRRRRRRRRRHRFFHLNSRIMEHFQNDDLEYVVDDFYDFDDFEHDDPFAGPEFLQRTTDFDSDFEDDFESNTLKTDTSAMEARNGKDIQGIPWERLNFTRNKYRETRLKQYKNYESIGGSSEGLEKECLQVEKGNAFYAFQFNTRLVKSTIVHFQDAISILFQPLMQVGSNF